MKVVDTNVIAYLFIRGEQTTKAQSLLMQDFEWVAPPLWRSEFLSALSLYIRKGLMSLEEAEKVSYEAEEFMRGREQNAKSSDVLKLSGESNCSAYDCEFVALAKRLNTRLITSDRKVLKAFPDTTISLDSFPS